MKRIIIYEKTWCPFCKKAREFFTKKGLAFELIDVEKNRQVHEELISKYDFDTVPMIFIGEKMIGGFSDLMELEKNGELQKMLF